MSAEQLEQKQIIINRLKEDGCRITKQRLMLLGYPIEDVVGFMEHSGKEYLYSGYWKVYENVSAKKQIFVRYDEARETLIRLLANDIGIRLICEIYKKNTTSHYVELVAMVS